MKIKVNKNNIITICIIILLISAIIYNLVYINNKKNEIIEEINIEEVIEEEIPEKEEKIIYVDVSGEVNCPGLYSLPEGSRVNDAVFIAGGITDKADMTDVNLAYMISDAKKITIPKKEEKIYNSVKTVKKPVVSTSIDNSTVSENGSVNINTADESKLKTLSGIGDSTAKKIIDYRNKNGNFNSIEDIKNVSGIGEAKFNNIKDKITI